MGCYMIYFMVMLIILLMADSRADAGAVCTYMLCVGYGLLATFFVDGIPAAMRKTVILSSTSFSILLYVLILLALYLRWMRISSDVLFHVSHVYLSATSQCANALINIIIYLVRVLFTIILYPGSLVLGKRFMLLSIRYKATYLSMSAFVVMNAAICYPIL